MKTVLFAIAFASCLTAQTLQVKVGKHSTAIPRVCEGVVPAVLNGEMDQAALIRESICKGAGDIMIEYTYLVDILRREKKYAGIEQKAWTYEVFIPTLKSGITTTGILILTKCDGLPVPPDEQERSRLRAAQKLEDEEERISKRVVEITSALSTGMQPLGTYTRTNQRGNTLDVSTFLKNGDLTLLRRESQNGRDTLIFGFSPRRDAQFNENEKYIAQLTGEISIDASDHIVTKLVAWPSIAPSGHSPAQGKQTPAVSLEMLRLNNGFWLPAMIALTELITQSSLEGVTWT